MLSKTIERNSARNQIVKVICETCKILQKHIVVTSLEEVVSEEGFESLTSYQIVQCQNCEGVSFRRDYTDSDCYYHDDETGEVEVYHTDDIYPNRTAGRFKIKGEYHLPFTVRVAYGELILALNGGQKILAGLGIRVVIEIVCKDKEAEGKNLLSKIDDLALKGVLTKVDAGILHQLRVLGNESAHEAKPSSNEQLNLAMDVVEHLLLGAYIHPVLTSTAFKR
ncbi:hypothetical protein AO239_12165 [Pseudomonas sp. ICMP 19500]|nr:hypothetical protein AO239_12165 [Pseudomonas sp. ICMP 19500]